MSSPTTSPASPCLAICRLDERDICTGCHRTLDEIRRWRGMDDSERQRVLKGLAARAAGK